MGSLKEYFLELEEQHHERLAAALGISGEELAELEYELSANFSKQGMIYNYIIQFDPTADPVLLSKIENLSSQYTTDLPPWIFERSSDDEYVLEAIVDNIDHKANFEREMEALEQLAAVPLDAKFSGLLLRQIFISIIGAVETYLSDAFINQVLSSDYYLRQFVETHPEFKSQNIKYAAIFSEIAKVREKAKNVMISTIYHKLEVVKNMYQDTFLIKFPDISELQVFITQRHDLVHRNGKTKDGDAVIVNYETVARLRTAAIKLVDLLSQELADWDSPF